MSKNGKVALAFLGVGHFISDSYSSTIYPLLPLLAEKLNLSQGQVFLLAPLLNITSSIMQPVYGFLADRYTRRGFAVAGPAITGFFVSLIGVAQSYAMLIAFLVCGGVGIGSFHPQGAALAASANKDRRRIALSIFSSSGTLGFALGPVIITSLVEAAGIGKTYYLIFFGFIATFLLLRYVPSPGIEPSHAAPGEDRFKSLVSSLKTVRRPMLILYLITVARSGLYIMTNNYLPFVLSDRGFTLRETGATLTTYLLAGAIGGIVGGFLAERFGGRVIIIGTGLLAPPLLAAAYMSSGPLSIVLLAVGGFGLMSVFPVNVAAAQELAPRETSTVSALMMGFAWGVGSLAPAAFEPLTVSLGFGGVLALAAVLPLVTSLSAFFLPKEKHLQRVIPEPSVLASPFAD
jgi:FSR family fosmidomycin resistance protein-like MFS transporter